MTDHRTGRRQIEELLGTMLDGDGYRGVIRDWPQSGSGRAKIEIIATPEACEDCLVPKSILVMVLADNLPDNVSIEEADLTYPGDRAS
jgi:hypothetical protein